MSRVDCTHLAPPSSMLSDEDLKQARQTRSWRTALDASALLARSYGCGRRGCGAPRRSSSPHTAGTSCERRSRAPTVCSSSLGSCIDKQLQVQLGSLRCFEVEIV